MLRVCSLALCALALSGCMSRDMQNPTTGQAYRCEAWGFGVIGLPVALISYDQCVRRMEARGFQ